MKRFILVTLIGLAMVLLPSVGLGQRKEEALRLQEEAEILFGKAQTPAELQSALKKYETAIRLFQTVGQNQGVGEATRKVGNIYIKLGQYDKAVSYYEKALAISRQEKDRKAEGRALNNLGYICRRRRQYDKAAEYCKDALAICREAEDKEGEGIVLQNLGHIFYEQRQYDKAEENSKNALAIKRALKDRMGEADVLGQLGTIYTMMKAFDKAEKSLEKSLAFRRELKDRRSEGDTLVVLGLLYTNRVQYVHAAESYEKALAIRRDLNDRRGVAEILACMGVLRMNLSQYDKAAQYYEAALAIHRDTKQQWGMYSTLNNLGIVYMHWGQYDQAVQYFENSLEMFRELEDRFAEGASLANLGQVCFYRGQYDKAVNLYEQSSVIFREVMDRASEGRNLTSQGLVYLTWGQYDKAAEYYEKALTLHREENDRMGEGRTLMGLGDLHMACGRYDKAVEYYEKALAISRQSQDRIGQGSALHNLGDVQTQRGNRNAALTRYREALAIFQEIGVVHTKESKKAIANTYLDEKDFRQAETFVNEAADASTTARFFLLQNKYSEAKAFYEKLLASSVRNRNADDLFTAYTGLGLVYEGMNGDKKAAEYFQRAVDLTEGLRTSLTPAQREKFFDVKINGFLRTVPYEGRARVLMRMKKPKEALKGSEYTKARVFAETVSRQARGQQFVVPANVMKDNREVTDQLAALKQRRQKAYEKQDKLAIEALEPQIKNLEDEFKAHIKMLRDKYPLFAATKYPQPMDLSQTSLKEDEWVLSYDVTDSGVIVYLTKGKELVRGLFKPIAREDLDELVRRFRDPLELDENNYWAKLSAFDLASGRKLSSLLLADALPLLPEGAPVIVIPDDSLGVLPFEMLVLNDSAKIDSTGQIPQVSGAGFFGDRNPISYYQSVTALTLARTIGTVNKTGDKRLALADPVFDADDARLKSTGRDRLTALTKPTADKLMSMRKELNVSFPRLPVTGNLAKALKKLDPETTDLCLGMEASKPVLFEKKLTDYGSMIFATHGYFGKDLPGIQEPVLVLTLPNQPEGQDGFLRMSEVMGLKLNADIVALTACQTGLGRRLTGEGTMGMGRAFQYAGAKSVLMSLWSVAETSSVMLAESFFRYLKEGKDKLESLRLARKEIRESGYDHPFFWAGFILAGEVN